MNDKALFTTRRAQYFVTKGFTLIELLVVISIIGVLSTMIFSAIDDARYQARIARTIQDLQTIEQAFQMMIIAENMNCWPREGGNHTDVNCPISLIAENSPTWPNNVNIASTSISAALDSDTSPLKKYLPSSPRPAFPGIY